MTDANGKKSSPLLIAVAWLIVVAPTMWGLTYTVQNALKIFTKAAPVTAPSSPK
jgi:hypothetical protein